VQCIHEGLEGELSPIRNFGAIVFRWFGIIISKSRVVYSTDFMVPLIRYRRQRRYPYSKCKHSRIHSVTTRDTSHEEQSPFNHTFVSDKIPGSKAFNSCSYAPKVDFQKRAGNYTVSVEKRSDIILYMYIGIFIFYEGNLWRATMNVIII